MNSEAIRLSEIGTLEHVLTKSALDIDLLKGVNNETDDILNKLGVLCSIVKPTGFSGSNMKAAVLDMENRRLLKNQHFSLLKGDVKAVHDDGHTAVSALQQDINELANEIDLRTNELEQSTESSNMNAMEMHNVQSELALLDEYLEKSGINSINVGDIKKDYAEYLKLTADATRCTNRISTLPVQFGVSLDKNSVLQLLEQRKEYLNRIVGEVYEKSTS